MGATTATNGNGNNSYFYSIQDHDERNSSPKTSMKLEQ